MPRRKGWRPSQLNRGRCWAMAYYRRRYPKLLRLRELLRDGAIGQPVLAEALESLGTFTHEGTIDLRNLGPSSHSHVGGQLRAQNLDNSRYTRLSERG